MTPQTDPDHCEPCPYNTTDKDAKELPQSTCQYRLMRDCLDALKRQKVQITMLEHGVMASVNDFIKYFIEVILPSKYAGTENDYIIGRTAFDLGAALEKWQKFMEE